MKFLPLFHNIHGRKCLLVGGGETALRKVRPLIEAGAIVEVVAPDIKSGMSDFAETEQNLTLTKREFCPADITDCVLVIAATNNAAVNRLISELAEERNIPVNVVDNPELCSVIFPSIIDRSPIQIAISTGGTSPVLARLLRGKIEALLPAGLGKLATLGEKFRGLVKERLPAANNRRKFWETIFEGVVAEKVYSDKLIEAEKKLLETLDNSNLPLQGEVYLVGGGPGDPDLLTFKALRLMEQADIVLYDRLVSEEVLNLVRRDAKRIYVGKTAGDHPVSQANINDKLVEFALQGHRVLRLKGGDPFIFGRGGEEIEKLAENGIPFQVVPGITAASGCASYAGIPLTHRDYAHSVRFVAGHRKNEQLKLDWPQLITPGQTLVFYMGLNSLEMICSQLITHGMAADTPAALIEKGTTQKQRVFTGDLQTLPQKVREAEARAPTLIIVGHVVSLQNKLKWYGE